ncbi:hypothetical protein [Natronorubrum sp. DTA7]|uniref:hypothetical protein n=1 Tax=Natronorubrum sp. DTA7 TaxID=3447016 RepID=UPI003F865CFF
MVSNQRNVEVITLLSISALLFLDVFLGVSEAFPDGWFHLLLGVFLLGCGVVLFINERKPIEE